MNLKNYFASIKDTEHFMERTELGSKTPLDYASQYVYFYNENAKQKFINECSGLEINFFNEVLELIK